MISIRKCNKNCCIVHVTSSSSYLPGVIQQLCVALTVTTQMVQLASAHGTTAAAWGEPHHLFFSLQLPFFALSQRLSLPVTLSVSSTCRLCLRRSAPLSVSALAPATRNVCCPDAANHPCKKNSPASRKQPFSSTQLGSHFLMLSHLMPKPHQCRSFAGCCECQ